MLHCPGCDSHHVYSCGTKVGGFAKIGRARISPWHQITRLHQDSVRYAVMNVPAVIVGVRRERSGERIDPGARADAVLVAIQP